MHKTEECTCESGKTTLRFADMGAAVGVGGAGLEGQSGPSLGCANFEMLSEYPGGDTEQTLCVSLGTGEGGRAADMNMSVTGLELVLQATRQDEITEGV